MKKEEIIEKFNQMCEERAKEIMQESETYSEALKKSSSRWEVQSNPELGKLIDEKIRIYISTIATNQPIQKKLQQK